MTDVPHFAFPLRYVNGSAVVNEQDSIDDIADCVTAICLTQEGERDELPEFGITELTFQQQPVSLAGLLSQIATWEPRAALLADSNPDLVDIAIMNADINVRVAT